MTDDFQTPKQKKMWEDKFDTGLSNGRDYIESLNIDKEEKAMLISPYVILGDYEHIHRRLIDRALRCVERVGTVIKIEKLLKEVGLDEEKMSIISSMLRHDISLEIDAEDLLRYARTVVYHRKKLNEIEKLEKENSKLNRKYKRYMKILQTTSDESDSDSSDSLNLSNKKSNIEDQNILEDNDSESESINEELMKEHKKKVTESMKELEKELNGGESVVILILT